MELILINRERLQELGTFLVSEFDSLISRIRGAWRLEHNDDDTHSNVHAQTIATGRLTFSDIASTSIEVTSANNFTTNGLGTAAILRLNSTLTFVSITGIQLPQDEAGVILDGRLLLIENVSTTTTFSIEHESTLSSPGNRLIIPNKPSSAMLSSRFFMIPGSITVLVYNAAAARWVIQSKSVNEIYTSTSFGTVNDHDPTGRRSSKVIQIEVTAGGSISGLVRTSIPTGERKVLSNVGLYKCMILHANTGSVAENRFYCPGGVRYMLNPRETVNIVALEGGGWGIEEKADQWVDVIYADTTYAALGGVTPTWVVDSGDVTTLCYHIDGNKMTVSFDFTTTTITGAPTSLTFTIPNARTAARTMRTKLAFMVNNAVGLETGWMHVIAGGTVVNITKDVASAAFANGANNNSFAGQITFMVTDACASISESHTDVAHGDTAHSDVDHSDVAHSDVAHGDSHGDQSHTDAAHQDTAHSDSHTDTAHSDSAHSDSHTDIAHQDTHSDVTHVDITHVDVAHEDVEHSDAIHQDFDDPEHVDHGDGGHDDVPAVHHDEPHGDTAHSDTAHSDVAHDDVAHSDTHNDTAHDDVAHSDSAHSDVAHVDTHGDAAHSDVAHVDGGHDDSHSDTPSHSDIAHVDVAHGDTAHADNVHQDVGMHCDTAHADI